MSTIQFPDPTYRESRDAEAMANRLLVDRRRRRLGMDKCECGAQATHYAISMDADGGDKSLCWPCWQRLWNRIKEEAHA